MLVCHFCNTNQVDNTIFCSECGTYLLSEDIPNTFLLEKENTKKQANPLDQNSLFEVNEDLFNYKPQPKTPSLALPPTLLLRIEDSRKIFKVVLDKTIHFGRLDPSVENYPEVDLTNQNGLRRGVSRQHLKLLPINNKVFAEDMGSINGSYLNDKKLTPHLPEPIADGDRLKLGGLTIQINFQA